MSVFKALFPFSALLVLTFWGIITYAQPNPTFHQRIEGNKTVIVMVHGILGSWESGTWGTGDNAWYEEIKRDFEGADIFLHDYPADFFSTEPIRELAENMNTVLLENDIFDYENIIFVAHSMGGLVTRQFVIDQPEHRRKIRFALFLGTPSTGAHITNLARIAFWNNQINDMFPADAGENYARRLGEQWSSVRNKFAVYCGYERHPTGLVKIVPYSSSTHGCTDNAVGLQANHFELVKPFMGENDRMAHILLSLAYEREIPKEQPSAYKVVTLDSKQYRAPDDPNDRDDPLHTNGDEIQRIIANQTELDLNNIAPVRAWPVGWDAGLVTRLNPKILFMHWSAFEQRDENCPITGANIDNGSCQRLIGHLNRILRGTTSTVVLYTRTERACSRAQRFFSRAVENRHINRKFLSRLVILDLQLGARQGSFQQAATKNVVGWTTRRLLTDNWAFSDQPWQDGVCQITG